MGKVLRYLRALLLVGCCGTLLANAPAQAEDRQEEILVGRIAHVEGKLFRYIDEEKDWVLTVKDTPFAFADTVYSGDGAKAELLMPNGTWLRIGEATQVQLLTLQPDATTIDVASGVARLYNKDEETVIKVTTPFGFVVARGGSAFDLYVGEESLEVIAVRGSIDFVHEESKSKYLVHEGSFSIIADRDQLDRGNGAVDAAWDDWNVEREKIWNNRLRRSEYSAQFLPRAIREHAHVLEEHGRWERVYYEGAYRDMWRPMRVEARWRPFTTGRWTVYYGDNCWIPDEEFGYVTHHYGAWVYIKAFRAWYWIPPTTRAVVDTPRFFIGFSWYPGRVGWLHNGPYIGWVPLAPHEVYYSTRYWGHRTVVVKPSVTISSNINLSRYLFLNDAVVVHRDHFYRGSRYTQVYERNITPDALIGEYRPTTIINQTIINSPTILSRRFTATDLEVREKPHVTALGRIGDNHQARTGFADLSRQRIEKDLHRFQERSEPLAKAEIPRPRLLSKIVAVEKSTTPLQSLAIQEKELKPRDRERQRPVASEFERWSKPGEKTEPGGRRDAISNPPQGKERPWGKVSELEAFSETTSPKEARTPPTEGKPRLKSPREGNNVTAEQSLSLPERQRSLETREPREAPKLPKQDEPRPAKRQTVTSPTGEVTWSREQGVPSSVPTPRKSQENRARLDAPEEREKESRPEKPGREKARSEVRIEEPSPEKGRPEEKGQLRQEKEERRGQPAKARQFGNKEEEVDRRQVEPQRRPNQEKTAGKAREYQILEGPPAEQEKPREKKPHKGD